ADRCLPVRWSPFDRLRWSAGGLGLDGEVTGTPDAQVLELVGRLGAEDQEQVPVGRAALPGLLADLPWSIPVPAEQARVGPQLLVGGHRADHAVVLRPDVDAADMQLGQLQS